MLIKAEQRFFRMSPQKIREVVNLVRPIKDPDKMVAYLEFVPKRAALPLAKVVKQALANARNNKQATGDIYVKEIQVGDAPRLRRWRPGSRGMARPILKRMSHIRVILETNSQENPKYKVANSKQIQNAKLQ